MYRSNFAFPFQCLALILVNMYSTVCMMMLMVGIMMILYDVSVDDDDNVVCDDE